MELLVKVICSNVPHIVFEGNVLSDDTWEYVLITVSGRTFKVCGFDNGAVVGRLDIQNVEPQSLNANHSVYSTCISVMYTPDEEWAQLRANRDAQRECDHCHSWYTPSTPEDA